MNVQCVKCGQVLTDRKAGISVNRRHGPGDAEVAEIETCDSPHNKHCMCRVHDQLS